MQNNMIIQLPVYNTLVTNCMSVIIRESNLSLFKPTILISFFHNISYSMIIFNNYKIDDFYYSFEFFKEIFLHFCNNYFIFLLLFFGLSVYKILLYFVSISIFVYNINYYYDFSLLKNFFFKYQNVNLLELHIETISFLFLILLSFYIIYYSYHTQNQYTYSIKILMIISLCLSTLHFQNFSETMGLYNDVIVNYDQVSIKGYPN